MSGYKMDWLTATKQISEPFEDFTLLQNLEALVQEFSGATFNRFALLSEIKPLSRFYRVALKDDDTGLIWQMPVHHKSGVYLQASGTVMSKIYDGGFAESFMKNVKAFGFKPSRVDIAADTYPIGRTAEIFKRLVYWSYASHRQTDEKRIDGRTHALTFGSRTSDRYMRIYDKALEQRMTNQDWIRFEIEFKNAVAASVFERLVSGGEINFPLEIARFFGGDDLVRVNTYVKSLLDMTGDADAVKVSKRQSNKSFAWLFNQVVPSVAKMAKEDYNLFIEFMRELTEACEEEIKLNAITEVLD